MARIPVESSEREVFTPTTLVNIENPPVFTLRAPNERHVRRFRQLCADDGLNRHSAEDFTAEKVVAIKTLWLPEDAQPILDRFTNITECLKQSATNEAIVISDEDRDWLIALDEQLFENHKPLRVMRRETDEWYEYAPRYAISTFVVGWQNVDLPFKLEAGYVPPDHAVKLVKALTSIEKDAIAAEVEGVGIEGTAFIELWAACMAQTRLDEDEEKNSPAPSPISSSQEDLQAAPDNQQSDGASTEESSTDASSSSSSPAAKTPSSA